MGVGGTLHRKSVYGEGDTETLSGTETLPDTETLSDTEILSGTEILAGTKTLTILLGLSG